MAYRARFSRYMVCVNKCVLNAMWRDAERVLPAGQVQPHRRAALASRRAQQLPGLGALERGQRASAPPAGRVHRYDRGRRWLDGLRVRLRGHLGFVELETVGIVNFKYLIY